MKQTMKVLAIGLAAGLAWAAPMQTVQAEGTVQPIYSDGVNDYFQSRVFEKGLAELGYEVLEPLPVSVATAHVAVGNRDGDFYAMHWNPLHTAFFEQSGGEDALWRGGALVSGGALQGYLIDKATADAHGITTLDQLQDTELAKLFDINGDGTADLYGCNPGWGCERVIEHQLTEYSLRDTVTHNQGGYDAIIPDAIARFNEGKPVLYYTWTPMWVSGVLVPGKDVTWLNVPYSSLPDGREANTTVEGLGNLGFEVNLIQVMANREFVEANPMAKRLMEVMSIPLADVSAQNGKISEGESTDADLDRHADEWIAANRAQFDAWLDEARAAQ